jgi:hypothetical protein
MILLHSSSSSQVLATGDDSSKVKLFRWPAPLKDSESHSYNVRLLRSIQGDFTENWTKTSDVALG